MLKRLALLISVLVLTETALYALGVGDFVEFEADYYGRSNSRNFIHEFKDNIKFAVPPGTTGAIQELRAFPSGNYGIRVQLDNGRHAGEEAWFYYNSPKNLHGAPPLIELLQDGKTTSKLRRANGLRTLAEQRALQTKIQRTRAAQAVDAQLINTIGTFQQIGATQAAFNSSANRCPLTRQSTHQQPGTVGRPQNQIQAPRRTHAHEGLTSDARAEMVAALKALAAPGNRIGYSQTRRLGPNSYDCSGLVQTIYGQFGMHYQGNTYAVTVSPRFREIPASQALPGDISMHLARDDWHQRENHMGILTQTQGEFKEISATSFGGDAKRPPSDRRFKNAVFERNLNYYPGKTRFYRWVE